VLSVAKPRELPVEHPTKFDLMINLRNDATEPAWNEPLRVACLCGVVFERWITPEEADADLLRLASLN